MGKAIALEALRRRLSDVVREVAYGHETYTITTYGRPTAVLIGMERYECLTGEPGDVSGAGGRVPSPHLADPNQAKDFQLQVTNEHHGA